MEMKVLVAYPPNIEAIDAAFQVRAKPGVLYTYGDRIYNPSNAPISAELAAHEAIHSTRQGSLESMIERWWGNYIADPEFRLREELPAHQAEYRRYCQRVADGNKRVRFLMNVVAKRLSGPLYANLLSHTEAMKAIREAMR